MENIPNLRWKNFRRDGEIKEVTFNGRKAVYAAFLVDENVLGKGKIVERKIERVLITTKNDIFNIVFGATDASKFKDEEKEFNEFMNSLVIKES